MKRKPIDLCINELIIDGINPIDPQEMREAISRELTKWLGEKNLTITSSARIESLLNEMAMNEMTTASDIGQHLKNTLKNNLKLEG